MVMTVFNVLCIHLIQGQDSSDCNLIPHYSADRAFVSFTSATHDSATIRVEEDGHITVSTEDKNHSDDNSTLFNFIKIVSGTIKIL